MRTRVWTAGASPPRAGTGRSSPVARAAGYPEQSSEEREAICASTWLPVLCTESDDVPRLIGLLAHEEGLARINAAKTLAWQGELRAVEPIAQLLRQAKAEADYGYCGTFKFDEYNDPTPRWREAFVRALGLLDGQEHTAPLDTNSE